MKKRLLIIAMFFMLCTPFYVDAASVKVTLKCPTSAKASSTVSCTVSATPSGANLKGIQANIKITNGTYSKFTLASNWTSYSNSSSGFSLGRNTHVTTTDKVGTLNFKMPSSGSATVTLSGIVGSDKNYKSYEGSNVSATVRVQSTVNTLKQLSLSNGTLSPTFNANTLTYSATINSSSTVISATKTDSNSKITGTGTKQLDYGENKFNIIVTSESGGKKTYVINITRPDNRSKTNTLKNLSTNGGSISFNKNTLNYNLEVESDVTSLKINAEVEDSKSSFVKGYGPRTENLKYGKNSILIKVKAENGSIKTYTINVTRKDNRSSNNYLKDLTLGNGSISFDKNTLEYNLTVKNDVTKLNITADLEDSKAKVQISDSNLKVGNNTITITVTSESQVKRVYKLYVKRLSEDEMPSDNNNVKDIVIKGHDISFQSDKDEYDITIGDEYALVFEVTLEDEKANYQIVGNDSLKNGSVIKVVVTSESGNIKEYKFNIKQEEVKTEDNGNILYCVLSGFGGFVLGSGLALVITKKKKR